MNHPDGYKFGTVGPVFPGSRVRLGEGDEIQIAGPGVMDGYHNLPDETAETLTEDGWLRTGDMGELDSEGFLTITDRKKELIKTSGGKYIAPQAIEGKLKAVCPYVSQVIVLGDERNYVVALVTLDPDADRRLGQGERRLRRLLGDRRASRRRSAVLLNCRNPRFSFDGRVGASAALQGPDAIVVKTRESLFIHLSEDNV